MSGAGPCLEIESLARAYANGSLRPAEVVDGIHRRIEHARAAGDTAWLHVRPLDDLLADVRAIEARRVAGAALPLFGLPFGVKDNIDVAGLPTTVACPALTRVPEESALVVQRLVDAGAIVVGKTNLDQLATGLVGVRSPYGVPTNSFDSRMIPGGSSSGSAVVVARGEVTFALGTDTAGSGRVPAAFNNLVGLKPTRGVLSARGVVPACRSIDCVSVFALTVGDACAVADVAKAWDGRDPYSRADSASIPFFPAAPRRPWRIGVPQPGQREFFGDTRAEATFAASLARFEALGCVFVDVDLAPFRRAGELLYGSARVAERLVAGGALLATQPEALLPVIRDILIEARRYDAVAAFEAAYELAAIAQVTGPVWRVVDALLLPTTPTIYSVEQVLASPRALNANLGIYTTFTNLLDLAAIAVPAGLRSDGLPAGITLFGPAGSDARLAAIADAHHQALGGSLGATGHPLVARKAPVPAAAPDRLAIAVVGAHLSGQPLNHQLTSAGGTIVRAARTSARYKLVALPATTPPKPGLARVAGQGHAIELEVWSLDAAAFGQFVARVPPPLCIGSIELEDRSWVHGFLCEPHALDGAEDISRWGGWLAYLKARVAG